MTETIVISLGGSVINPGEIDKNFLYEFSNLIKDEVKLGRKFVIVCGGGSVSRKYIGALPESISEASKDIIGIIPTWLNAQLLSYYFKDLTPPIIGLPTFKEVIENQKSYSVALCGGLLPGIKTDEDAAIFADYFNASCLINITNVDGVYNKDPNKFEDAKKYDVLTYKEFFELIGSVSIGAGSNAPFTFFAAKISERSKIPIIVVSKDILSIKKALYDEPIGTKIVV